MASISISIRLCVAAGLWLCATSAGASSLVIGGGAAKDCANAALDGRSDNASVTTCTLALETEILNFRDLARTYVNRGVLHLRQRDFGDAVRDFDAASKVDPNLGEAYVNRGAAYVGSRRYGEGLTQIDRGLAMGVKEPQKAYFNRAIAHENLGDVKSAYLDYSKAAELDPDWDAPKTELTRFTVKRP
jgi:tetratricopeptide (TPR) repeat protein